MVSVKVEVALTRNLGDFNSIKVGGAVEDEVTLSPDAPKSEVIRQHFQRLYDLVSEEVDQAVSTAVKELKK